MKYGEIEHAVFSLEKNALSRGKMIEQDLDLLPLLNYDQQGSEESGGVLVEWNYFLFPLDPTIFRFIFMNTISKITFGDDAGESHIAAGEFSFGLITTPFSVYPDLTGPKITYTLSCTAAGPGDAEWTAYVPVLFDLTRIPSKVHGVFYIRPVDDYPIEYYAYHNWGYDNPNTAICGPGGNQLLQWKLDNPE